MIHVYYFILLLIPRRVSISRSSCVSHCFPLFPTCLLPGTLEPCLPRSPPLCLPACLPLRLALCILLCLPLCLPPCLPLLPHFVSHIVSLCVPLVFQLVGLSPIVSSTVSHGVSHLFYLVSCCVSCFVFHLWKQGAVSRLLSPAVYHLFSTCLPVVSQMSLLVSHLPLSLELETVTAVGLQHWLNQPHKGYTWDVPRPTVQHLTGSNAVPHRRKGRGTF